MPAVYDTFLKHSEGHVPTVRDAGDRFGTLGTAVRAALRAAVAHSEGLCECCCEGHWGLQ